MRPTMVGMAMLAAATFISPALAESTYQSDAAHDGAITLQGEFSAPLRLKWSRDLVGYVSYPLIANGIVFVTVGFPSQTPNAHLMALNLSTGETIWDKTVDSASAWANAALDGNRLFVINYQSVAAAYSADVSGKLLWSAQIGQGFPQYAPTAYGGVLYAMGSENLYSALIAIDENTGGVKWWKSAYGYGSPAVGDGGVYVSYPCQIDKFDLSTGSLLWENDENCGPQQENIDFTPVYHSGRVYVRDWFKSSIILDSHTGALLGSLAADQPPAFYDDISGNRFEYTLFGGLLFGVDATSGNVVWSFKGDGKLSSPPIVINGIVVEGSASGRFYLIDGITGARLWYRNVGAPIAQNNGLPKTGLGAGEGALVIPATTRLSVYRPRR